MLVSMTTPVRSSSRIRAMRCVELGQDPGDDVVADDPDARPSRPQASLSAVTLTARDA